MDVLIATAIDRFLTVEDIEPHCKAAGYSFSEFSDAFARRVVERYLSDDLSWSDADVAMNHVFEIMTYHCAPTLPDYGWGVYLAFDAGEYIAPFGDEVTKPLLAKLHETAS